jgi:hypothetical protein
LSRLHSSTIMDSMELTRLVDSALLQFLATVLNINEERP